VSWSEGIPLLYVAKAQNYWCRSLHGPLEIAKPGVHLARFLNRPWFVLLFHVLQLYNLAPSVIGFQPQL
jgi:hypothetical protein